MSAPTVHKDEEEKTNQNINIIFTDTIAKKKRLWKA